MGLRATRRKNVIVRHGKRVRLPDVPHLRLERALWANGKNLVVGLDEAGCGAWAGPVTVGAVVLDPARRVYKIRDSKMLDPARREELAPRIQATCVAWSVAHATSTEIDAHGLSGGRRLAARRALETLGVDPDACLVDGHWDFSGMGERARRIVHGDAISLTIAAASIIAKVTRDRLMTELAPEYPHYDWASNKGYPSPRHRAALAVEGPCPHHRRLFAPIAALSQLTLFEEETMGQPVEVTVKDTLDDDVRIFETNRWLTGMGSGVYARAEEAPEGSMARMILDTGDVEAVHVYGSTITVTKQRNADWDELAATLQKNLENFYIFYPENIGKKFVATDADPEAEPAGDDDG
jgi:ribonuclease HII